MAWALWELAGIPLADLENRWELQHSPERLAAQP